MLVVAIHTSPWGDRWFGFFLREYCARIAVPFFLIVSGYFYHRRIKNDGGALFKTIVRLLKTYFFWSIPYILINLWVLRNDNIRDTIGRIGFDFLVNGSYYHFWFFPAVIYAIVIISALYWIGKTKLVGIVSILLMILGCLGTSYRFIGNSLYIIQAIIEGEYWRPVFRILCTGVPYVGLGVVLSTIRIEKRCFHMRYLVEVMFLYVMEKLFLCKDDFVVSVMLFPLTGMVLWMLLSYPMSKYSIQGQKARTIANVMYYMHPAYLLILSKVGEKYTGKELTSELLFISGVLFFTIAGQSSFSMKKTQKER